MSLNIRFATNTDIDQEAFLQMVNNFIRVSPYKDFDISIEKLLDLFEQAVNGDKSKVLLLYLTDQDWPIGFILGVVSEPLFSRSLIANEIAWWVNEEYRGNGKSLDLVRAYEDWAVRVGCENVVLSLLPELTNPHVVKVYERLGFRKAEEAYLKEIRI